MTLNRRYINAKYPNPYDSKVAPGHEMWLCAKIKRGKKPKPPTVTWYATRTRHGDDGQYVEDPKFKLIPPKGTEDIRWACVTLPQVTGVRWAFKAVRHKDGKTPKTFEIEDEYQTWKRIFLDVETLDPALYRLFCKAMPKIERAFADAHVEVVENRVKIAGKWKKKTDRSTAKGRTLGDVYQVVLEAPKETLNDVTYTFSFENKKSSSPAVAMKDGKITITLESYCRWKEPGALRSIDVTVDHEPKAQPRTQTKTQTKVRSKHKAGSISAAHSFNAPPSLFSMHQHGSIDKCRVNSKITTPMLQGKIREISKDKPKVEMIIKTTHEAMTRQWHEPSETWRPPQDHRPRSARAPELSGHIQARRHILHLWRLEREDRRTDEDHHLRHQGREQDGQHHMP